MTEYRIWTQVPGYAAEIKIYFSSAAQMVSVTKEWETLGIRVLSAMPVRKYS